MAMVAKAARKSDESVQWDTVWFVGIIPMAVVVAAVGLSFWTKLGVASLAAGLPIIGISVFVGLYEGGHDIRSALAGAFMMAWLFLFAITFNATIRDILKPEDSRAAVTAAAAKTEREERNIARALADDFKTMGIFVFSFYFGGLAVQKTVANLTGHADSGEPGSAAPAASTR